MAGPALRPDIVEVYVFRRLGPRAGEVEFLQMRRAQGAMIGSWQPVMGHMLEGETTVACALRELAEETGYGRSGRGLRGLWQLEDVNTYFLASHEAIVMSPGFAAEVEPALEPALNAEHDALRWVRPDQADQAFLWPGQRRAVAQIVGEIIPETSPPRQWLRIALDP